MTKFKILLLLSFITIAGYGQDITRHEADSLLRLLDNSRADTARINLLLRLAKFQIFKPGEFKPDLDSAAVYINRAKALNATLKSRKAAEFTMLVEAFLIKEQGQKDVSKKMVEHAIEVINADDDKSYLADAYFELSDYYDYNDPEQLKVKIKQVDQAVAGFKQNGNKERQAFCLKVLGDLYDIQGDAVKSLQALNLSLEIYNSIHYTRLQGVYTLLGGLYYEKGNYHQAMYYELLALKSAENDNDTSMNLCEINNALGVISGQLGEKEKAIYYYKKALQIAEKYDDNSNVLLLLSNIVEAYNRLHKPAEGLKVLNNTPSKFLIPKENASDYVIPTAYLSIYYNLENYNKARVYANQVLNVIKNHKPEDRKLDNIYQLLVNYSISAGELQTASMYLKIKDSISRKISDPNTMNQNTFLKFRLDTALGNFKLAMYDLLRFNKVKDSLFNETKSKQIKQLEIDYDTRQKEDSLKIKENNIIVLKQKNRLQQSEVGRAHLVRDVTFAGIALLFVIIGLLYRQYRIKQQSTQVIRYKNEMLEHLLKEVHHRVKNNLHTVICLLESQAAYLENDALKAIETSQHRIYAMSLIHQKLYQSEDVKAIDMAVYLPEFIRYLNDSFDTNHQIKFQLNIDPLQLGISQAIPIALIINEAVTNSIKYAFPNNKPGIIKISMHQSDKQILLTIADNGIGIDPAVANATSNKTLGLELMKGLTEDIHAQIKFENDHGTKITISFKVDPFDNRTDILNTGKEKELSF